MHAEVENYWRYSRLNQSSAIKSATSSRNVCTVVWEGGAVRLLPIPMGIVCNPKHIFYCMWYMNMF